MIIKDIVKETNWLAIPEVIKEYFTNLAPEIECDFIYNESKNDVEYIKRKEIENVFFSYSEEDTFVYIKKGDYDKLNILLDSNQCQNHEMNFINRIGIEPYLKYYVRGFVKGYTEFESTIKKDSPLFGYSKESLAHKVFSRIMEHTWTVGIFDNKLTIDSLTMTVNFLNEKNMSMRYRLDHKKFFESGLEGGEFYKAWEIILENAFLFEPIFKNKFTNNSNEQESEPVDLSDKNVAGKIALLYELGIIDYLKNKDNKVHSVNSIASLLSGITGDKIKTIFPAINPLLNTESRSNGKPPESTLQKAREKIISSKY